MTGSHLPSSLGEADLRIESIGNYKLTGNVLGKGHFARVEEASHMLLNVKVCIFILNFELKTIDGILMCYFKACVLCLQIFCFIQKNKLQSFLLDCHHYYFIDFAHHCRISVLIRSAIFSFLSNGKHISSFERQAYTL